MGILGNLVTGGLSMADTALGSLFNSAAARKQDYYQRRQMSIAQDYQKELMNKQFNSQLQMWNLQNEYNSPAAQMQRLEDAGLNPALVYGNGNALTPASSMNAPGGSAPSNGGPQVSPARSRLLESYMMSIQGDSYRAGIQRTNEEIEVLREQANKLRIEQLMEMANVDAKKMSNKVLQETLGDEIERVRLSNQKSRQDIALSQSTEAVNYKTLSEIDARIAEKAAHIRNLDASSRLSHANAYLQEFTASYFARTGFLPSSSSLRAWIDEIASGLGVDTEALMKKLGEFLGIRPDANDFDAPHTAAKIARRLNSFNKNNSVGPF